MTRLLVLPLVVCLAGPAAAQDADPEQALADALSGDRVFLKNELKPVRAAYAVYFRQKHRDDIRAAFAGDTDAITAFLDQNPDVRDTLFTAIDPETDDVRAALTVFRELYKLGPEKLKANYQLAVAAAAVWDDPKAVYDYRGHQVRTRATLPADPLAVGAKENYEFYAGNDALKGPVQSLPWEFLAHVVNHRTPVAEREWAVKGYAKKRVGIGTSYKEVQYDTGMLRSEMANGPGNGDCRLTGRPYTLESIKLSGGVCAMQTDFAARVAKSVGVPAEYVGGEANAGGRHAWVMWVELKAMNKEKVEFALMSEGRYLLDQYYVGELIDPRTGRKTTDRDMERRLTTVGQSPQNARQADLLMRAFPVIKEQQKLSAKQQLDYLRRVFEVFPHSERAWLELAELSKDGRAVGPADAVRNANRAFTTFANFPDFSWKLFDTLLAPQKDKFQRAQVYEKAVLKYESLGRPDLACECRLKLAGYQADAKDYRKAADGLAQTILKFPGEGRYVPKMLAELEEVCGRKEFRGGADKLAKFYLEFLPRVPKTRGDEVSEYCVKTHEQAARFFRANRKEKEAAAVEQALARLKGGRG